MARQASGRKAAPKTPPAKKPAAKKSAPKKRAARNKGGRPPALKADEATLGQIRNLAGIFCTQDEAGAVLGVSRQTFNRFLNSEPAAQEAWDFGQDTGRASLRRMQWRHADKNPTMAIFLGKNYLGQRSEVGVTGPGGGPLLHYDLTSLSDDELAALESIHARLAASRGGESGNRPPES